MMARGGSNPGPDVRMEAGASAERRYGRRALFVPKDNFLFRQFAKSRRSTCPMCSSIQRPSSPIFSRPLSSPLVSATARPRPKRRSGKRRFKCFVLAESLSWRTYSWVAGLAADDHKKRALRGRSNSRCERPEEAKGAYSIVGLGNKAGCYV